MAEATSELLNDEVSDMQKETVQCHPCSRKSKYSEAEIYCADCDEVQCLVCANDHQTFLVMGHHVTMDIKEWRKLNDFFDLANISRCEEHGLHYDLYCEHENKLCCKFCRDQFHSSCNIVKISEINHQEVGTESKSLESRMMKLLEETSKISSNSNQLKEQTKNKIATLPGDIDAVRKNVVEVFDKFEEALLAEAKLYEAEQETVLDKIESKTADVTSDIQNSLKNLACIPKSMTPSQRFVLEKKMSEVIENNERKVWIQASKLRNLDKDIKVEFSACLQNFTMLSPDEIGSLKVDKDETRSDHIPDPKIAEYSLASTINAHPGHEELNPLYLGMDFLRNDRLVLADNKNKKCVIMSSSLKMIGEKQLQYAPRGLLVFGNDELLISSGEQKFIDYFMVNAENILIHNKRINTPSHCDSMSVIADRCFTVGVAHGNTPVCKLSNFEEFSYFNLQFDREAYKLGETKCVYCPRLEMLVLIDKVTDSVTLIDSRSGEKTVVKNKLIKQPRCAVIGQDESIFLCCEGSCCLVQISPSGEILSYRRLRMSFPYSICISKDKSRIAISNKSLEECKVQVFNLIY